MTQELELAQLHADADAESAPVAGEPASAADLRRLAAVPVDLSVEIGRTRMTVGQTLELREGSVITLDRMADEPVDLLVNGTPIAHGEVVVIDEQFGLRVTRVIGSAASVTDPGAGLQTPDGGAPAPAP